MILTRIEKNGINLVFDETGEAYYPGYHALTRVCSLNNPDLWDEETERRKVKRLIEKALKGQSDRVKDWEVPPSVDHPNLIIFEVPFFADIETAGGIQKVMLISRALGTIAIKELNGNLYEYMAEIGHLAFLHQLAGYKVTSSMIEPQQTETSTKKVTEPILDDVEMRFDRFIKNIQASGLDPRTPRIQQIAKQILGID